MSLSSPTLTKWVGAKMVTVDTAAARLPLVLVIDPVASSRLVLWRLLSRSFGVIEAPNARRARACLEQWPHVDAIVVQRELPDTSGEELVSSLSAAHVPAAARAVFVSRPIDLRSVLTTLSASVFAREPRRAAALQREADRLIS
jgi:response regulator RpfG family c-di-GMP phosphodiesterase